jgi:hypothetical protein
LPLLESASMPTEVPTTTVSNQFLCASVHVSISHGEFFGAACPRVGGYSEALLK